jgi:hypothetical protein
LTCSTEELKAICMQYHERIHDLEDKKFDIEYIVKRKDYEVREPVYVDGAMNAYVK